MQRLLVSKNHLGILAMALSLLLASLVWAAGTAKIEGRVSADGQPVKGAKVILDGYEKRVTKTNAKGHYEFSYLSPGAYTLIVSKKGFKGAVARLKILDGQKLTRNLVIKLKAQPAAGESPVDTTAVAPSRPSTKELAAEPVRRKPRKTQRRKMGKILGAPNTRMARPAPLPSRRPRPGPRPRPVADGTQGNTEHYQDPGLNLWTDTAQDKLSTFSVDVDTASYTIARRKLREGQLPPAAAVRTEEFVNYFRYNDPAPKNGPFAVSLEAAPSPFDSKLTILRVGLKGQEAKGCDRKAVHLTFLVDTSGSMNSPDKLGLLKRSLRFLVDQLQPGDTVALSTYAGSVREVLAPTGMQRRAMIHDAIEGLSSGGSTAMASGLELAYKLAYQNKKAQSVNRIIVCSDGDANVGATKHGDMLSSIKKFADQGITLSTIGFGMGNYKDHRMEQLANKGNGNYFYIDSYSQAKRVFGAQLMGTLQVIAKDVKLQVEFNPGAVRRYRLIGYENRDIADQDFRNDKVDAGEIGAGHSVTALYELEISEPGQSLATVRVRWKKPQGQVATEAAFAFDKRSMRSSFSASSPDFKRAVAAAALAENLRNSPFKKSWNISKARQIAQSALDKESPEELELIELIETSAKLMRQ